MACLLPACAPNRAPVVERPVTDARPDPARVRAPAQVPLVRDARAQTSKPAASPPQPAATSAADAEDWRPETYSVRQGDTLYAIALDHGQDYRDLAEWNSLPDPNVIRVGQLLRVKAPAGWSERPEPEDADVRPLQTVAPIEAAQLEPVAPPPLLSGPRAQKLPYSEQALAQLRGIPYKPSASAPTPAPATARPSAAAGPPVVPSAVPAARTPAAVPSQPTAGVAAVPGTAPFPPAAKPPAALPVSAPPPGSWAWPVRGRLLQSFANGVNPKGIAIAATAGDPVVASAAGKVVYSGSGLRGYGKLVIVKHDRSYLSVYAHNRELLVREGERVDKGQKIAEVGSAEANRPALHFEIRKLGKPVDPLQYLAPP